MKVLEKILDKFLENISYYYFFELLCCFFLNFCCVFFFNIYHELFLVITSLFEVKINNNKSKTCLVIFKLVPKGGGLGVDHIPLLKHHKIRGLRLLPHLAALFVHLPDYICKGLVWYRLKTEKIKLLSIIHNAFKLCKYYAEILGFSSSCS